MNRIYFASLVLLTAISRAQSPNAQMLRQLYTSALTESKCYSWLDNLTNKIGPRLSGSENAQRAVKYVESELNQLGLDRVYLQEVMVPKWVRGARESARIIDGKQELAVPVCALGGSVATPPKGLTAEVIEVMHVEDLAALGPEKLKGKIVFFNRPMKADNIDTFDSYAGAVDQRGRGAREAAKYGAVGVIVRSMNMRLDDYPHTGWMGYGDLPPDRQIPAAAISTNGAEKLSAMLKLHPGVKMWFRQDCKSMPDVLSYNVIGEIKGAEHPERIMVVGGHLDSWDLAQGAQDDGAGVVQSMEVLHLFKVAGYKPKNTIRAVLFMNEENGGRGGAKYNELAQANGENHIFALESDCGGFTPRGFSIESNDDNFQKVLSYKSLFEPYLIHLFFKGHTGSDIEPLQSKNIVKAGLRPDTNRYFDYHHAATDRFEAVDKRELELGAATMAALTYLIDSNGIQP